MPDNEARYWLQIFTSALAETNDKTKAIKLADEILISPPKTKAAAGRAGPDDERLAFEDEVADTFDRAFSSLRTRARKLLNELDDDEKEDVSG